MHTCIAKTLYPSKAESEYTRIHTLVQGAAVTSYSTHVYNMSTEHKIFLFTIYGIVVLENFAIILLLIFVTDIPCHIH